MKYITFGAPDIGEKEIKSVVKVLKSGWIGTGSKVTEFEEMVKKYVGAKYAVALNSCTAGLHLSLLAAGIGHGDEVITTPFTFCATANAIVHAGAKPVFVDINIHTMNIDENLIEKAITKRTKAIIPVHFAGRPCEMDKIIEIAREHKLLVIEDAAHALGAKYKDRYIGNIGDLTCFSFYVTKNVTTGEGGMVTTNNKKLADKIKMYALHGMDKDAWMRYSDKGYRHYDIIFPGFKYNMTDLNAAIGIEQMKRIKSINCRRDDIWDYYSDELLGYPMRESREFYPDYVKHAKHLYTLLIDKEMCGIGRDDFMDELHQEGIGSGIHFIPLHLSKYYRERFGYKRGDFPNAEWVGDRIVSIPFNQKLTTKERERIIRTVKEIIWDNCE